MPICRAALSALPGSTLLGPPKTVPSESRTEVPPHFAGWKNATRLAGGASSAEHGTRDRRTNLRSIGFNTCSLPRVSSSRSMAALAFNSASLHAMAVVILTLQRPLVIFFVTGLDYDAAASRCSKSAFSLADLDSEFA